MRWLIIIACFKVVTTLSCTCDQWDYEINSVKDVVSYDLVVKSKVVDIDTIFENGVKYELVKVEIKDAFSGKKHEEVQLKSQIDNCKYDFKTNTEYLMCLNFLDNKYYQTNICTHTKEWSQSLRDIFGH